jgi:hypothetical protein
MGTPDLDRKGSDQKRAIWRSNWELSRNEHDLTARRAFEKMEQGERRQPAQPSNQFELLFDDLIRSLMPSSS